VRLSPYRNCYGKMMVLSTKGRRRVNKKYFKSMPPVGVFDGKMYVGTDVENTGPERMVKVDADKNCIEMCILEIISTGLVCVI